MAANQEAYTSETASGAADAPAKNFAGEVQGDALAPNSRHSAVPAAIVRRYLKVDDRYLFPDRTVAFVDKGSRIRVRTENREVIHSVVAIAQQRGWQVIKVSGSRAFRQAIWKEAAAQGMGVKGYRPTDAERDQADQARSRHAHRAPPALDPMQEPGMPKSVELGSRRTAQPERKTRVDAPPSTEGISQTQKQDAARDERHSGAPDGTATASRRGARAPIIGTLLAAAAAPYKFDPEQRISYYVTVGTEHGERTVWGADLERALIESVSQPRPGATVVLTQLGTRPVNLRVPDRNDAGDLEGEKKIVAQRSRWGIENVERMQELQQASEMVRSGITPGQTTLDAHPSLAKAAAGMKLAQEYAQRVTTDPASQQRLVDAIRERLATAVQHGQAIHLPTAPERAGHELGQPDRAPSRQRGGRTREDRSHERM